MPDDPAQHEAWLTESADLVAEAVAAAGDEPVWTFTGPRPARWWARRRAHEVAVHLADAQFAAGRDVDLAPGFAADGVDQWLGLVVAAPLFQTRRASWAATARPSTSTPPTPTWMEREWLVARTPSGITVEPGHAKADVAVRAPAARPLLPVTRRLPASEPGVEIFGEQALLTHWLEHPPF